MVGPRNYPVVMAVGVAVVLFGLVGATALTGVMPQDVALHNPHTSPFVQTTASAAAAKKSACRTCGVISAIRPVQIEQGPPAGSASAGATATRDRVYRVVVRMDDGTERSVMQPKLPALSVGTRVRINGTNLERG